MSSESMWLVIANLDERQEFFLRESLDGAISVMQVITVDYCRERRDDPALSQEDRARYTRAFDRFNTVSEWADPYTSPPGQLLQALQAFWAEETGTPLTIRAISTTLSAML